MRVLVDSDVFCKLGIGNMLSDLLAVLGADIRECGRLPALPHMLRKGRLPKIYGAEACARLVPLAESIESIKAPDALWLDRLTLVNDIDPGEAQLFAAAARDSFFVITGDKRALQALKDIEGYADALAGRVVVLESAILALCDRLGCDEVSRRLGSLTMSHTTLRICFSTDNLDPRGALASYYRDLVAEVHPLLLWEPQGGTA